MAARGTSWLSWPSLVRTLASHVRLTVRLLREPGVPLLIKALPVLAALYVISSLEAFLKLCPGGRRFPPGGDDPGPKILPDAFGRRGHRR
jgi:hypothetical protein